MDKGHKEKLEKEKKKKKNPALINDSFVQEIKVTRKEANSIMSSKLDKRQIIHERI